MLHWTSEYLTKPPEAEQFYPLQRLISHWLPPLASWEDGFSLLALIVHTAHNSSAAQYISELLTCSHQGQVSSQSLGQSFYRYTQA